MRERERVDDALFTELYLHDVKGERIICANFYTFAEEKNCFNIYRTNSYRFNNRMYTTYYYCIRNLVKFEGQSL